MAPKPTRTPNNKSASKAVTPKVPVKMEIVTQKPLSKSEFAKLTRDEREKLLTGPMVAVCSRGRKIIEMPKRLLLGPLWYFALDQWGLEADERSVLTMPDCLKQGSIYTVMHYFKNVCSSKKFYALPTPKTVGRAAAVYQTLRMMFLDPYMGSVMHFLKSQIRREDGSWITYEDLACISRRAEVVHGLIDGVEYGGDPLMTDLADILAGLRYKGEIPDPNEFETWLADHHVLQCAMSDVDEAHKQKRTQIQELKAKNKVARTARLARKSETQRPQATGEVHIGAAAARKLGKKF